MRMSTAASKPANIRSRLLIAALLGAVMFLSWETVVRTWDLYRTAPLVDLPGHFLAGIASTALAYWYLQRRRSKRNRTDKPYVLAVLASIAIALLWEAIEKVQEVVAPDPEYLRDVFWWDGFTDVIASTVGAVAVFPILRWLRNRYRAFQPMDV
jgi:uncharacterized membrane protein YjdF